MHYRKQVEEMCGKKSEKNTNVKINAKITGVHPHIYYISIK
jgi:hypothetical protein